MTLLLKQIFNFLKILNSETGTNQIAAGIAVGFVLGMSPGLSIQSLIIFICIFIFRIQAGAALISAAFFAFAGYLLDPLFHMVGSKILEAESLQGLFTTMYNMPLVPLTRFNNSIYMGSGFLGILLAPFIFILSTVLIVKYRKTVVERFKDSKFWKAIKATSFYKWYAKYDELYN